MSPILTIRFLVRISYKIEFSFKHNKSKAVRSTTRIWDKPPKEVGNIIIKEINIKHSDGGKFLSVLIILIFILNAKKIKHPTEISQNLVGIE